MGDNPGKSFKVPKKKKENKDCLWEIDVNSRDAKDITSVVQRSYIETSYMPLWQLKTIQYVQNRELEERYRQKRSEMKEEGRNARDLAEQYTFLVFRDATIVPKVAKDGLNCRSLPFNALGNSKLGLYLSRNADIHLRLAENWEADTCTMFVFKTTPGKCKVLMSGGDGGEGMEPTPNYDCHVAQYQPRPCDPIHLQLARSQIYLYEYTEDCEPSASPRHCLPYAVLTYQKSQNKSQSSQPQTDSYSKRPAPLPERNRTDQNPSNVEVKNKVEPIYSSDSSNRRDPRLSSNDTAVNTQDPRLVYARKQGGDMGLCVPRLTPGPPPQTLVAPQGSGQPWTGTSAFQKCDSPYQPSFGPQLALTEDELTEKRLLLLKAQEQSLLLLKSKLLEPKATKQNIANLPPKDPRLRKTDPRLDPRLRDRRPQKSDSLDRKTADTNITKGPVQSILSDKDSIAKSRKRMSFDDYKQKVGIQPSLQSDIIQEGQGGCIENEVDRMYDPSDPTSAADISLSTQSSEMETSQSEDDHMENDGNEADLIDNPDDMKKTLNEMIDTSPVKQSPKAIADEVEEDDPTLAAAMRMLVDHSGDVSLLTEALQKLQESAEELGDALHDPSFLVKAIAENVESLKKSKSVTSYAEQSQNNTESEKSTPGLVESRDSPVYDNNRDLSPSNVLHCPRIIANSDQSPMAKSMKSTLEELQITEQVTAPRKDFFTGEVFSYSQNDSGSDRLKVDAIGLSATYKQNLSLERPGLNYNTTNVENMEIDVEDIPLPESYPDPPYNKSTFHKPDVLSTVKNRKNFEVPSLFQDGDINRGNPVEDKDERTNKQCHAAEQKDLPLCVVKKVYSDSDAELDRDYRVSGKDFTGNIQASQTHLYELSADRIDVTKVSDITSLFVDKDDRYKYSFSSKPVKDLPLELHVNAGVSNDLKDVDERSTVQLPEKSITSSKREGNDAGVNFRDKDERIMKAYMPAIDDPCLLDKDERKSKSRSQSPMDIPPVFINGGGRSLSPKDETEQKDRNINDNRIRSRSASLSPPVQETSNKDVKIIPLHNLDDSQGSSDSGLFDAYSVASKANDRENEKKFAESAMQVNQQSENEFGDVDWRLAAEAAEMGDIDLRASQSSDADLRDSTTDKLPSSTDNLMSQDSSSYSHPEYTSYHDSSSYSHPEYTSYHDTRNMEPILDFQDQSIRAPGSYSTNKTTVEGYTTYKDSVPLYNTTGSYADQYRASNYQEQTYSDKYSYSTGGRENSLNWSDTSNLEQYSTHHSNTPQAGRIGMEGLQNIMNNLDFSSLRNILAVVQQPALSQGHGYTSSNLADSSTVQCDFQKEDESFPESGQAGNEGILEKENQPAFCTGLSFLKSKQPKVDKTRAKYSGLAKGNTDIGQPNIKNTSSTNSLDMYETGNPDGPIPLIGDFPQNTDGLSGTEYDQGVLPSRMDPPDKDIWSSENVYPTLPGFDPPRATENSSIIPGLTFTQSSSPPSEELVHNTNTLGKPFTFSEDIPERDISSEWYEEISSRDSRKTEKSESKVRSPKKKSQRTRTESHNSENEDSWQNAILESIEQSALAVKSDDSMIMEVGSPQFESETKFLDRNEASRTEGKRTLDEMDLDTDHKRFRADIDTDDEDNGLVIDLGESPTSEVQEPAAEQLSIVIDDEHCHDDEIPQGTDKSPGRSTPILDEHQEEQKKESDGKDDRKNEDGLADEDEMFPTTNHELKKFIERKRKNIVIKLKGETKIVNPKTGKAYNDNIVGSAIEVLGQPKRVTSSPSSSIQQIHPLHGITSSSKPTVSTTSDFTGSSIATLINRNAVPSQPNLVQQTHVVREYTHPYTGQNMVYPISGSPSIQQPPQDILGQSQNTSCQLGKQEHVSQEVEKEHYGMTIPTLGSQSTRRRESGLDEKPSTSKEDYSIRTITITKKEKNYEFSKTSANKYIKTEPVSDQTHNSDHLKEKTEERVKLNLKIVKHESNTKERVTEIVTGQAVNASEPSSDHIKTQDTAKKEADDDSELEEGEISDDDDDDDLDIQYEQSKRNDNTRLSKDHMSPLDYDSGKVHRYRQEYSDRYYSPYETGSFSKCLPHKGASQWTELLQNPERKDVQVFMYHRPKPQPKASPTSKMDKEATSVLSKSAETITKAKQKMLARNQVKTLGDWLKVEFEIDNIGPLQSIIPYSLNTDLSVIPKKRRRKIRLKVKNTIEKEGIKQSQFETETEEQEKGIKFSLPSYLPEVSHDQIDRELKMLRDVRANLHKRPFVLGDYDESTFVKAVCAVEEEMFSLLSRTNYFGYPHRRVPNELLLESESKSYRSDFGDIFLILMSPISLKAYNKLIMAKSELETLYVKKSTITDGALLEKNEQEIKTKMILRQNLLRAFTGYLNKKRVSKVQELADNFTMVYEFLKAQTPPYPDSVLRFIRTAKMDIKQHVLIAKKHLEMEEKL